jgi:hypothetical protein
MPMRMPPVCRTVAPAGRVGGIFSEMEPGGVWYTTVAPGDRRLFRGRHYRRLALTDGRLVVTARSGSVLLDTTVDQLRLTRVRNGVLLQVLARDGDAREHVFEFRPRRHAAGRALADALR